MGKIRSRDGAIYWVDRVLPLVLFFVIMTLMGMLNDYLNTTYQGAFLKTFIAEPLANIAYGFLFAWFMFDKVRSSATKKSRIVIFTILIFGAMYYLLGWVFTSLIPVAAVTNIFFAGWLSAKMQLACAIFQYSLGAYIYLNIYKKGR